MLSHKLFQKAKSTRRFFARVASVGEKQALHHFTRSHVQYRPATKAIAGNAMNKVRATLKKARATDAAKKPQGDAHQHLKDY